MPIKSVADIRLTAVSDAAWAMATRAREKDNYDKLEADALRLAKDNAIEIIDLITNNQAFVDAAFEAAVYDQDSGEQRQMNNAKTSQEDNHKIREPIL